jgi:tRNA-2-methylthio-N6-dimethylallyladenosine synthase
VTEARTAGLPGFDVGMVPAFNAFPASSITLAYTNAALLMAAGAKVRMSAAAALYTALAVAAPSEALTLCSSLNAPQKLVAPPMITLCLVAAILGDFAAVGLLDPLGAVELAPFGVVELDAVGAAVDFELATLLVPEEHPASTPATTNMRKSRRIVATPLCGRFASRTITLHRNAAPAIGTRRVPVFVLTGSRPFDAGARTLIDAMKTYQVRTYGCQMNVHDSERLSGLLESAGYVDIAGVPDPPETADVVVFNTCAVRENADNKLYGNLGQLRPAKMKNPAMQIAVGGCLAQKDRATIVDRAPWVDVVFGTHNMGSLPALLDRARHNKRAEVEILESLDVFPSTLPTRRDSAYSAFVSISVGCNNTCTFCIVPTLRGKEMDRRPGAILAEIEALVDQGVIEVTLLGQNVNSYGVEFGDRLAFGKLLRACGQIAGLERVRFTSPHPAAFTDDVVLAMAETPNVMPSLHMPLQSGSDRVLKTMRRSYRSAAYLGILDTVRQHIPGAAITTDLIVGFPGETEQDFQETLDVVRASLFAGAFTFQYSVRPGTPAATMADQIPKAVVQERYERLLAVQEEVSWAENLKLMGCTVEVLVAQGEGRKDAATQRLSGRARDNRLVHFAVPQGVEAPRPGDIVEVDVTRAAPHHLVADSGMHDGLFSVRRTSGGDAWAALQDVPGSGRPAVTLGMPSMRRPRGGKVAAGTCP